MPLDYKNDEQVISLRDFPFPTIVKLLLAIAFGTGLFFFAFHMMAWAFGWPGPFLWFSSTSRIGDILGVSLIVPMSLFMFGFIGAAVIKAIAMIDAFNLKMRL